MKFVKNLASWFLLSILIAFILYKTTSLISNTITSDVYRDFDIMLKLIGFLTILSSNILLLKMISTDDKMKWGFLRHLLYLGI